MAGWSFKEVKTLSSNTTLSWDAIGCLYIVDTSGGNVQCALPYSQSEQYFGSLIHFFVLDATNTFYLYPGEDSNVIRARVAVPDRTAGNYGISAGSVGSRYTLLRSAKRSWVGLVDELHDGSQWALNGAVAPVV